MVKNFYKIIFFACLMTVIMSFGIAYAVEGKAKSITTSTSFGAGMIALLLLLYVLRIPSFYTLWKLKNKSTLLNFIIISGLIFFPITPILIIIYLKMEFKEEKDEKQKLVNKNEVQ